MSNPQEQLRALCRHYGIRLLYAFGSRGQEALQRLQQNRALSASTSDLDIGILPSQPLTVVQKVALAQALEALFGVARVDLVVLPEADPFLAANIIRGERLFALDSDQADEYELYLLRRAGDLAPLERERLRLVLEKDL